jgi:hypothetical protein
LYFFIDKNAGAFSVLLNSASRPGTPRGGETAAADLYDPEGKWVAGLSTVAASTDSKIIKKPAEGFWKLKVKEAPTGALDDVYVRIEGQGTSGFVSFDPDNALIIEGRD